MAAGTPTIEIVFGTRSAASFEFLANTTLNRTHRNDTNTIGEVSRVPMPGAQMDIDGAADVAKLATLA